jgi:hypothetical protein
MDSSRSPHLVSVKKSWVQKDPSEREGLSRWGPTGQKQLSSEDKRSARLSVRQGTDRPVRPREAGWPEPKFDLPQPWGSKPFRLLITDLEWLPTVPVTQGVPMSRLVYLDTPEI